MPDAMAEAEASAEAKAAGFTIGTGLMIGTCVGRGEKDAFSSQLTSLSSCPLCGAARFAATSGAWQLSCAQPAASSAVLDEQPAPRLSTCFTTHVP